MRKANKLNRIVALLLVMNLVLSMFSGSILYAYATDETTAPTETVTGTATEAAGETETATGETEAPADGTEEPSAETTEPADSTSETTEESTEATDSTEKSTEPTDSAEKTTDPTEGTEDTTQPTEEADDFLLDEFEETTPQTIEFDYSGIDSVYDWYMADVEQQLPEAGKDYGLVFPVPEGYAHPETLTVKIDNTEYAIYTDGQEHRETPEDGSELPPMPTFTPDSNTLTVPAVLLTVETAKLSVAIEAVPLEDTTEETTGPTVPEEESSTFELTANSFEATLYNEGSASGDSVTLTADGGTEAFTLGSSHNMLTITWVFTQKEEHTLDITVPAGMYIVSDSWTTANNIESADFTALDIDPDTDGLQQGTGNYYNAETGTLRYTTVALDHVDESVTKEVTLTLQIGYDYGLWDKKADLGVDANGNSIGLTGSSAAVIITQDSGKSTQSTKKLNTVKTAEALGYTIASHIITTTVLVPGDTSQSLYYFYLLPNIQGEYPFIYETIVNEYTMTVTPKDGGNATQVTFDSVDFSSSAALSMATIVTKRDSENTNKLVTTITEAGRSGATGMYFGRPYITVPKSAGLGAGSTITITVNSTITSYSGRVTTETATRTLTIATESDNLRFAHSQKQVNNDSTYYGGDDSVVESLGYISIYNDGLSDAENVPIKYLFDKENSGLRVYGLPIPLPKGQTTKDLQVTLVDAAGKTYGPYSASRTNPDGSTRGKWLSAKEIAQENDLSGEYYLREITYSIPSIATGEYLYGTGDSLNYTSAGSLWGRLVGESGTCTMTIWNGVTGKESSRTITISKQTKENLTTDLILNNLTGTTLSAGQTGTIQFRIDHSYYPYANTTYTQNPTVVFSAPKGITVEKLNYTLSGATKEIIVHGVTQTIDDNNSLYIIPLGTDAAFPQFTITDNGNISRNLTGPTITLTISADINGTVLGSYEIRDRLAVTDSIALADGIVTYAYSGLSGSNGKYKVDDYYDIDKDSSTEDELNSTANDAEAKYLNTVPATSGLTVKTSIKSLAGAAWLSGTSSDRTLETATGDNFYYRLLVSNETGSAIPQVNSAIYIPILEAGEQLPMDMGGLTPAVGTRLKGPVAVTGSFTNWNIRYSMDATKDNYCTGGATFDETGATWLTADQVNGQWHKVTMVKVVIAEGGSFPADGDSELLLTICAEPANPGTTAIWDSAVWNLYREGDVNDTNDGAGFLDNTAYTRIKTATKKVNDPADTTPDDTGEDKNYILRISTGTATDTQGFSCGQISTNLLDLGQVTFLAYNATGNNMTLVPASQIRQNITNDNLPSVTEQDQTFALEVSLNNGETWVDVYNAQTQHWSIGNTQEAAETPMLLRVIHYNTFIDATTDRYISLFIRDEQSSGNAAIESTLEIHIVRTLTSADATTGIAAGKIYGNIGTTDTSVSIASDGAFTAQFALRGYVPENYDGASAALTFSSAIPAGSRLILIDLSESGAPKFYSYDSGSNVTSIALSSFKELQGTANFSLGSGAELVDKNLLLIADFSSDPASADFTMTLSVPVATEKDATAISSTLTVDVGGTRSFSMSVGSTTESKLVNQMQINLALSSAAPGGYDARWINRQQALIFKLDNGTKFPAGAYIQYGNSQYTPSLDGSYILVPIGSVGASETVSLTLCTPYVKLTAGSYTLTAERWISATAQAGTPKGGDKVNSQEISFTVAEAAQAALKLDMGTDRVVTVQQAQAGIALTIERALIADATALTLTVEQKGSGGYSTFATFTGITGNSYTAKITNITAGTYRFILSDGVGTSTTLDFVVVE